MKRHLLSLLLLFISVPVWAIPVQTNFQLNAASNGIALSGQQSVTMKLMHPSGNVLWQETRDDVLFLSGLAGFIVGQDGDLDTLYLASPNVYFTATIGGDTTRIDMQSVPYSMFSFATDIADAMVMEDVFVTDLDTDRVAMGVETASVKLHTDGGMRIGDTTGNILGVLRYHDGDLEGRTAAGWTTIDYAPSADYVSKWGINGTEVSTNFRVGIGDATPSVSLSVSGNGRVQGDAVATTLDFYGGTLISVGGGHEFRLDGRIDGSSVILDPGVDQWTGAELRVSGGFFGDGSGLTDIGATALASGGVASSDIANFGITQAKIIDNAVDNRVLGEGAIDLTKFAAGLLFTDTYFADGSITGSKIGFGQISSDDLSVDFSLPSAVFLDDVILTSKITDTEIIGIKIATGAVTQAKFALDAVTSAKVTGSGVVSANIGAGVLNADKIAAGAISAETITGIVSTAKGGTGATGGVEHAIPYFNGSTIDQSGTWKWNIDDRELQYNSATGAQIAIDETDSHALIAVDSQTNATASIQLQNNADASQFAISPAGIFVVGATSGAGILEINGSLVGLSFSGASQFAINGAMTIGDADQSPVQAGTLRFDGDFKVFAGGDWRTLGGATGFEGVSQGLDNDASETNAVVLGGVGNFAGASYSVVIGGTLNNIDASADHATIGGGFSNLISSGGNATYSTILGGEENEVVLSISSLESHQFIGGGSNNETQLRYSFVGGGNTNRAYAQRSGIWGGKDNTINSGGQNDVILGGENNTIQANADFATIAGGKDVNVVNDYNVKGGSNETFTFASTGLAPGGHYAAASGGRSHTLSHAFTSVAGGASHQLNGSHTTALSGVGHTMIGALSGGFTGQSHAQHGASTTVLSGRNNSLSGDWSALSGADDGIANGAAVMVLGGAHQYALGNHSVALPGLRQSLNGAVSVIGGGKDNRLNGEYSIVMANQSQLDGHYATVMGGAGHSAKDSVSVVGGLSHEVSHFGATAIGGHSARVKAELASAIGGAGHHVTGDYSSALGGLSHRATGRYGTVLGGAKGRASGDHATIIGGQDNHAQSGGVAMGQHAHASNGSFAFSDGATELNTSPGEFVVAANGGVSFITGDHGVGSTLMPYGGGWSHVSDRNTKTNFESINYLDVLAAIGNLPTSTWRYKSGRSKHIGPMAQDFYGAFGLGESDTQISAVDADGVALAGLLGALDLLRTQQHVMTLSIQRYNLARTGLALAQDKVSHMPHRMNRVIRSIKDSGPSAVQLQAEGQELDHTMSRLSQRLNRNALNGGQAHE